MLKMEQIVDENESHFCLHNLNVPRKTEMTLGSADVADCIKEDLAVAISEEQILPAIEFDDILLCVGEFGPYQILLFFVTAPFSIFLAFIAFSQVFITLVPDHWCHVPQFDGSGLSPHQRRELSIPLMKPDFLGGPPAFDPCNMYDIDYETVRAHSSGQLIKPNSSWKTTKCLHGWDYDLQQTRYPTIVSEYNWVCDDAHKPPLAQALFFVGSIIGGIISGYIADRFGRIPAIILCHMNCALAGIATAFSPNFIVFAFSRFIMGMGFENCFTLVYVLMLEYVGPKYRSIVGNLSMAIFFTAGTTVLPWIAWAISDWRMFSLATSIPMVLVLFTHWILPESPRWLLSQGKYKRAFCILSTFARFNKKTIDAAMFNRLKTPEELRLNENDINNQPSATVLDLMRKPRLRRTTILLTLLWVSIAVVYDGHARNTTNLGLNVFMTFSVASVTELPAGLVVVFFLDKWGRRALAFGSLLGSAVFSLATLAVPSEQIAITAGLAIAARLCVNMSFNIGLQYGAELLPTVVRAQGISCVHIAGYAAALMSPYIVDLARLSRALPLVVLGVLSFFGAICGFLLPETLNATLPQTIEQGENFGKDQSLLQFPCCSCRRGQANPQILVA